MKRVIVLVFLALLPARSGAAQTPPAADPRSDSASRADVAHPPGATLVLPSLPAAGLPLLEQASRLEQQRNFVEAHTAYSQLSYDYAASLDSSDLARLSNRLSELDAKMGEISFEGFAPGTSVQLGTTALGALPLGGRLRVNPGATLVTLTLTGYQTLSQNLEVREGQHAVVRGPLQPEAPTVNVTVDVAPPPGYPLQPSEALPVTIDGKTVGQAPWQGPLSVGTHRVSIQGQRFMAAERELVVTLTTPPSIQLALQPVPAQLQITAPPGHVIILDGAQVGESSFSGQVPAGQHHLRLEHGGVQTHAQQLALEPGQRLALTLPAGTGPGAAGTASLGGASSAAPLPSSSSAGADDLDSSVQGSGKGVDWSPGLYGDFIFLGLIGTRSNHQWNDNCPDLSGLGVNASCSTRAPLGLGIGGRFGYSFGVVGVEAFGLGAADWSVGRLNANLATDLGLNLPGFLTDMQVGRAGAGFGGGVRVTTPPGLVRARLGVGGGIMLRRVFSNVSSLDGSSTGYNAPFLLTDLSITLFSSFSLGAVFMVEFVDSVVLRPDLGPLEDNAPGFSTALGDVEVFQGTEYFFGPLLSFHFGH